MNKILFIPIFVILLAIRVWLGNQSFEKQQWVFPEPQKGVFRAWITEEPEVLFHHEEGSHDTGRLGGLYQPFVKEARAVCVLISQQTEQQPEIATSQNAPIGAIPGNNIHKTITPIKIRVTFRLSPEDPQPTLAYGDRVEIHGKILVPPPAMNPGQFDYAHYLRTKGVAYVMYAAPGKWKKVDEFGVAFPSPLAGEGRVRGDVSPNSFTLTPTLSRSGRGSISYGNPLIRWSCALKRKAQDSIYSFLPFPENALLDGLLLGERGPLPSVMVEAFMVTGTVHILAVSGMMTAFIAGLLFLVLRAVQIPRKAAAGLAIIGIVFFIFMTGAHPPVCRAGLFSILALAAVLFERRINGGVLLLATALLLTAVNPLVLEDLSFQISFLATAGLMVFSGPLLEKLSFLWKPAALLVTSTLAAQVSVWCLLIFFFNQLSLYSPLANLLIVPLALFATAAGLTAIAGGFLHPFLAQVFGAACWVPLKLLMALADKIALWPGAGLVVASPPAAWVLAFHGLFLAVLYFYWPNPRPEKPSLDWLRREGFLKKWRKILLGTGALFLLVSALYSILSSFRTQPLRLTFLAVGHGNAVVLRSPEGRVYLFDGGMATEGPDRYHPVVAYLRHLGVRKVAGMLDTHPDADHVGGLVNVLSAAPVGEAVVSPQAGADTEIYRRFLEGIQRRGAVLRKLHDGNHLEGLDQVQVELLHPPEKYQPRKHPDNNLSLVSLVQYGGFSAVLPGDIEKEGLLKLFEDHQPFPKVDWLMAPHHGRATGEPALCAAGFQPRFVVMSDGRDYPKARQQYQAGSLETVVLSTSREGAVEVEMGADGKGRYRSYLKGDWVPFSVR